METAPPWMRSRGWFQVGWSGEVGSGEVFTVRCFGNDVVLHRDAGGQALHALDRRCQHLGAHVGVAGTVAGDCIVCRFHGWLTAGEAPLFRELRRFCRQFEPLAAEPAETPA